MGQSVNVLIYGADRSVDFCFFDGSSEFCASRLHAGRVECATNFELECTLSTGSFELFASCIDTFDFAGDNNLSGAVVVCAYNAFDAFAYFFDFLVGKSDNGSHCRFFHLASLLHCVCTSSNEAETVFKRQCTGCSKRREFT